MTAARRPALYQALKAPDRIEGRFELLTLHAGLVLRRLIALGGLGEPIAQELVNSLFMHLDDSLRELAISDIGVSKRLKKMAAAFYGRNAAYAAALDSSSRSELTAALARNVYGAADPERPDQGGRARRLCAAARRGVGQDACGGLRQRPVPLSARPAGARRRTP